MEQEEEEENSFCSAGAHFFSLNEVVTIFFLHGCCTVRVIAKLLQLSKRFRRKTWDFLRDPHHYHTLDWLTDLYKELWHYKDRNTMTPLRYYNLHPAFVRDAKNFDAPVLRVARLNTFAISTDPSGAIAIRPGMYRRVTDTPTTAWPAYDNGFVAKNEIFYWYIIADAICAAFDAMILINHHTKCDGQLTVDNDSELFLCVL
jgi:hypothetical protein